MEDLCRVTRRRVRRRVAKGRLPKIYSNDDSGFSGILGDLN